MIRPTESRTTGGGDSLDTNGAAARAARGDRIGAAARSIPPAIAFGSAIGLSAFLLFTVQPMVGRLVTPTFGGAPAVWTTALAFYQVVLLAGYAYAHLVATRLSPRSGVVLHGALVAATIAFALVRPSPQLLATGSGQAVASLVGLLAAIIGPQAFLLCATTPLVSTWYARVRRATDPTADARDPYWLYALSNGGSLLALLAYPFLIEPRLGLSAQLGLWTSGLVVLGVAIAGAGAVHLAYVVAAAPAVDANPRDAPASRDPRPAHAPTRTARLTWVGLAAIPTALLSAVTNQVTTDLISAPLLWVVPLAIYLASFIVAFSSRGVTLVRSALVIAPVALTLLWIPSGSAGVWPIVPLLVIEYGALGVVAVAVHGRLAGSRPPDNRLTEFYLLLSTGGAIGGVFVAVVAPLVFKGVWELPIVIVAALVALALTAPPQRPLRPIRAMLRGWPGRLAPYLIVVIPLLLAMTGNGGVGLEAAARWILVGGLVLLLGGAGRFLALTTAAVLVLATFVLSPAAVFRDRSFFGVVEVLRGPEEVVLMHGTTVHGRMAVDP
ncbi:MAG TPA: hypothetical protein VGK16_05375, partial [Candidatus Limnocylindrales bacterium]